MCEFEFVDVEHDEVMSQKIEEDDVRWVPAILQNGAPFKSAPFSKWREVVSTPLCIILCMQCNSNRENCGSSDDML